MTYEGTYIRMDLYRDTGKTLVWDVENKENGAVLGRIKWFGQWRKYAFFPFNGMVFEQVCLREIADFIEARTKEHRAKRSGVATKP